MIDGTPWRVTDEGADAVDAAVIVDNNSGEVLGVSEWARIDDKPLADIVRAVNAHDTLVAALESCIEEINDLAEEIAQNGGVEFDRNVQWPEGSAIHQAQAALALARPQE